MTTTADRVTHALLFGVRRPVRYHKRRERFFVGLERAGALASLLAGRRSSPCSPASMSA